MTKEYIKKLRTRTQVGSLSCSPTMRWDPKSIAAEIQYGLKQDGQAPAKHWLPLLLWLTRIIEELRGTVHEGRALGYFVVFDDETRLRDSAAYSLTRLRADDASVDRGFSPWDRDGRYMEETDVEAVLQGVRAALSKGNYAWFSGSRHAILWDATFPPRTPDKLVRLRDSTWDVYVTEALEGQARGFSIPGREVLALAYLRPDASGGLLIRDHPVVRFRGSSKWEPAAGGKEAWLKHRLNKLDFLDAKELTRIVRLSCALSDDPHAGAMIVFLACGKSGDDLFWPMGDPWLPVDDTGEPPIQLADYSDSDLMALMAMDGATCLWKDDVSGPLKIAFRRLVTAPPTHQLHKAATAELLRLLRWEGSRKWSAAGGSHHPEVRRIVVVSQDGPLFVYDATAANQIESYPSPQL